MLLHRVGCRSIGPELSGYPNDLLTDSGYADPHCFALLLAGPIYASLTDFSNPDPNPIGNPDFHSYHNINPDDNRHDHAYPHCQPYLNGKSLIHNDFVAYLDEHSHPYPHGNTHRDFDCNGDFFADIHSHANQLANHHALPYNRAYTL